MILMAIEMSGRHPDPSSILPRVFDHMMPYNLTQRDLHLQYPQERGGGAVVYEVEGNLIIRPYTTELIIGDTSGFLKRAVELNRPHATMDYTVDTVGNDILFEKMYRLE